MSPTIRRGAVRRLVLLAAAASLISTVLLTQAGLVLAATPCSVWGLAPTTNGTTAYGQSKIDCPASPISDYIRGILKENFGPATWDRDDETNGTNSQYVVTAHTSYYCEGHGTDDWWVSSYGRDQNGGTSGWVNSSQASLTC